MSTIPTPAEELANSKVDPNARKAWEEALGQPEFANVGVIWAYSASSASDHRNGRCCDFMVTHTKTSLTRAQQVQMGNRIHAYFVKHAARLHVQGIIWNHQVTGFPVEHPHISNPDVDYRGPSGQARSYGGADQHTDHNHVQVTGEAFKPLVQEKPLEWDGHSFPGATAFHIGARGDYVTLLGQRLVAYGWKGYVEGPGPVFTDADQAAVRWFQERQGWTGDDADGLPGEQTWTLLMADPKPAPVPAPKPTPTPKPASDKPEGSTAYPAPTDCVVYADKVKPGVTGSDSVYWVQRWLNSVPLPAAPLLKLTGDYDTPTGVAAREFQASLGDALDGDLGPKQTLALYDQAAALNPDLPKPTFVASSADLTGADMPKLIATLDVPGAGIWQGALQDQSGYWLLVEAFTEGDCWIHRLTADGTYRDKMVLKVAAGYEVHPTGWALDNGEVWVTWNSVANDVVRFPYKAGATIEKKDATPVHVFSEGNTQVALSPGRDFAVLRRLRTDTETYVRRAKQALLDGRDEPIGKPVVVKRNNAKRTVQGFTVVDDVLAIITGRPSTGEPTLVSRYSFTTGKPLDVQTIALPGEPEGIDGKRVAIKQNTGPARRLKIYELR